MATPPNDGIYKRMIIDFSDIRGKEVYSLINQYRFLTGKTWKQFVIESIAHNVARDNEMVASAMFGYLEYLNSRPQARGRPVGYKLSKESIKRIRDKNLERWEEIKLIRELGEEDVKQEPHAE